MVQEHVRTRPVHRLRLEHAHSLATKITTCQVLIDYTGWTPNGKMSLA